jgi:hypothetical protein
MPESYLTTFETQRREEEFLSHGEHGEHGDHGVYFLPPLEGGG